MKEKNIDASSKKEKTLFITGIVFEIISLTCLIIVFINLLSALNFSSNNDMGVGLSKAIELILSIIFLYFPGIISSIISITLLGVSLKKSKKENRKKNLVMFIISIFIFCLYIAQFILMKV